mmetsp:Transcript_28620/g.65948  ORF Transcript_28620/g.65948 Transcript_28620/m.65948 type:complete len:227 (-) Transcript_28620:2419-3099(-)
MLASCIVNSAQAHCGPVHIGEVREGVLLQREPRSPRHSFGCQSLQNAAAERLCLLVGPCFSNDGLPLANASIDDQQLALSAETGRSLGVDAAEVGEHRGASSARWGGGVAALPRGRRPAGAALVSDAVPAQGVRHRHAARSLSPRPQRVAALVDFLAQAWDCRHLAAEGVPHPRHERVCQSFAADNAHRRARPNHSFLLLELHELSLPCLLLPPLLRKHGTLNNLV